MVEVCEDAWTVSSLLYSWGTAGMHVGQLQGVVSSIDGSSSPGLLPSTAFIHAACIDVCTAMLLSLQRWVLSTSPWPAASPLTPLPRVPFPHPHPLPCTSLSTSPPPSFLPPSGHLLKVFVMTTVLQASAWLIQKLWMHIKRLC